MPRARLNEDIRSLSDFQENAETLLEEIHSNRKALVLTQEGHNAVVVVDMAEYESLLEELETLRDIHLAEQQLAAGEGVPHELAREQVLSALRR